MFTLMNELTDPLFWMSRAELWAEQTIFFISNKFYRLGFDLTGFGLFFPRDKTPFRHLKRGIQDFHINYLLVPADKAANNVVVVWRLYYINTLKRELVDTNAYKLQPSLSERVTVDGHDCHTAPNFGVKAKQSSYVELVT